MENIEYASKLRGWLLRYSANFDHYPFIAVHCQESRSANLAKRLNVEPSRCLVFEDIIPGILAGKRAGMKVCAVDDLYSKDVLLEKKKEADYFIDSFEELIKA